MESNLACLLEAGTATISDVFDNRKQLPLILDNGLFPVTGPGTRFVGPCYPISGALEKWAGGADRAKLAAIDEMPPGIVALWAGRDMRGMCCFGDILAEAMKARGCAGVVVDGGIRDIAFLRNLGLPMMARYCSPASSRDRWRVVEKQVPVQVRGALIDWITVYPGDIIVADDDGVIVVPKLLVEDVTIRVRKWSTEDSESREDVRRGVRLLEVIEKYGHL